MNLTNNELVEVTGGAISINSTFINSIARIISTILDTGRAIGSAISRMRHKNYCW